MVLSKCINTYVCSKLHKIFYRCIIKGKKIFHGELIAHHLETFEEINKNLSSKFHKMFLHIN